MNKTFQQEQAHLSETHEKLQAIERELQSQSAAELEQARADKESMLDELATDFGNDVNLETYVELEAMHQIIDGYNRSLDINARRLTEARLLLRQPYFAKLVLAYPASNQPVEVYIGAAGMTDENRRHFIVDWRSPVAEVYYNQSNGRTSYVADERTIEVDLQLRRQFDIDGATLNSFFDTTVAIQDPLLLASLRRERSAKLRDITATIQAEQNTVIRHDDVPVLLVRGIAGSGKTSVLLQRIAYLLYRQRDTLRPGDVFLITPNDVFARYISDVLPDMGESNPQTLTWNDLMEQLGLGERGLGKDPAASAAALRTIDEKLDGLRLESKDTCDIRIDGERVIAGSQVFSVANKLQQRMPLGPRLAALVEDELRERLETRIKNRMYSEDVHDAILQLPDEEQFRLFGRPLGIESEEDMRAFARQYLTDRYETALDALADGQWLRVDRIGQRLLGKQNLTSAEYLYLKMSLTGAGNRRARFVMVDEVQDYTQAQLMVLSRYFPNAHFLLLGDENQAIREGTATFDEIRAIFTREGSAPVECQLLTSYRSSPEITALFAGLMERSEQLDVKSVQESGNNPVVRACPDEEYENAVRAAVQDMAQKPGLSAIIAADWAHARRVEALLGDDAALLLDGSKPLPNSGVVLLDLALAKGLEFDRVLIPDADARTYADSPLARRRLYTAISRATKQVTILARDELTPLLGRRN